VPVKRRETISPTGTAAFRRQPDALHPGKRENAGGESLLSPPAFSRFIVPV